MFCKLSACALFSSHGDFAECGADVGWAGASSTAHRAFLRLQALVACKLYKTMAKEAADDDLDVEESEQLKKYAKWGLLCAIGLFCQVTSACILEEVRNVVRGLLAAPRPSVNVLCQHARTCAARLCFFRVIRFCMSSSLCFYLNTSRSGLYLTLRHYLLVDLCFSPFQRVQRARYPASRNLLPHRRWRHAVPSHARTEALEQTDMFEPSHRCQSPRFYCPSLRSASSQWPLDGRTVREEELRNEGSLRGGAFSLNLNKPESKTPFPLLKRSRIFDIYKYRNIIYLSKYWTTCCETADVLLLFTVFGRYSFRDQRWNVLHGSVKIVIKHCSALRS